MGVTPHHGPRPAPTDLRARACGPPMTSSRPGQRAATGHAITHPAWPWQAHARPAAGSPTPGQPGVSAHGDYLRRGRDGAAPLRTHARPPTDELVHLDPDRGPFSGRAGRDHLGPDLQPHHPGPGQLPVLLLVPAPLGARRGARVLVRLRAQPASPARHPPSSRWASSRWASSRWASSRWARYGWARCGWPRTRWPWTCPDGPSNPPVGPTRDGPATAPAEPARPATGRCRPAGRPWPAGRPGIRTAPTTQAEDPAPAGGELT